MRCVAAALAVFVLLIGGASAACSDASTRSTCNAQTQQNQITCVWNSVLSRCVDDQCVTMNVTKCAENDCVPTPYSSVFAAGRGPCVNPDVFCALLTQPDCIKFPKCAWRSNSYCGVVQASTPGTTSVVCEIKFPTWSLALLVMWFFIMGILAFIIFLIMKKQRQAAIKGVETQEVVVDSVQIRDNFNLQQPLNH